MAMARGSFEVKLAPTREDDRTEGSTLGRLSLEKQFHGDLEAQGRGEMLSAMNSTQTSGAYVAIERVTGTLHGRRGSFVLQHHGTMTREGQHLSVAIVPDSGSDQLRGVSGTMTIQVVDGKHLYELDYNG